MRDQRVGSARAVIVLALLVAAGARDPAREGRLGIVYARTNLTRVRSAALVEPITDVREELDELLHRYKRSAQVLWSFGGSGWEGAALRLEWLREQGEDEPGWWAAREPPHRDG